MAAIRENNNMVTKDLVYDLYHSTVVINTQPLDTMKNIQKYYYNYSTLHVDKQGT